MRDGRGDKDNVSECTYFAYLNKIKMIAVGILKFTSCLCANELLGNQFDLGVSVLVYVRTFALTEHLNPLL